jgi:hypothetical protein
MEQDFSKTLQLLIDINHVFNLDVIDDGWRESYEKDIQEFIQRKKIFISFLERIQKMDIDKEKRDILWILVFAYRDFCYEFVHFERLIKNVMEDLE